MLRYEEKKSYSFCQINYLSFENYSRRWRLRRQTARPDQKVILRGYILTR